MYLWNSKFKKQASNVEKNPKFNSLKNIIPLADKKKMKRIINKMHLKLITNCLMNINEYKIQHLPLFLTSKIVFFYFLHTLIVSRQHFNEYLNNIKYIYNNDFTCDRDDDILSESIKFNIFAIYWRRKLLYNISTVWKSSDHFLRDGIRIDLLRWINVIYLS